MIPYYILFVIWMAGAIQFSRSGDQSQNDATLWAASTATALMIGLRYEVGGDWGQYQRIFWDLANLNLEQAVRSGDPAYGALCWFMARVGLGIVSVNLICGLIFMWGLTRLAQRQPNPWLAIMVAVPYFIVVVAMGYTRQATAIGIVMAAIALSFDRRFGRALIYVLVAAAFHKTAVLALPLIGVTILRKKPVVGAVSALVFLGAYFVFLSSSVDNLLLNYVEGDYNSQGAAIRISMDVLAATLFFVLRKGLSFSEFEDSLWLNFALASVGAMIALLAVASSSGVDRIALFLIPLQVVVFGRIPYLSGNLLVPKAPFLFAVIGYSAAVLFVWLNYADNAWGWVPYQAAPFAERFD